MTDIKYKHLNRRELLEIIYELQKTEEQLRNELDSTKKQLELNEIKISEAGSIAEAVAAISGIFEDAQKVADQYLKLVRSNSEAHCQELLEEAKRQASDIINQAENEAKIIIDNAKHCEKAKNDINKE